MLPLRNYCAAKVKGEKYDPSLVLFTIAASAKPQDILMRR